MPGRKLIELNSVYFTTWEAYRENVTTSDSSLGGIPTFSLAESYIGGEYILYTLVKASGCDLKLYYKYNNDFYLYSSLSVSNNQVWRVPGLPFGDYVISIINNTGTVSLYISYMA